MYMKSWLAGMRRALTLRLFQTTQKAPTMACLWYVQSSRACARIITNLCRVWRILESLLAQNLLDYPSTPELRSGVPAAALSKKNYVWILLGKLNLRPGQRTSQFISKLPMDVVRTAVLWLIVVSPRPQYFVVLLKQTKV